MHGTRARGLCACFYLVWNTYLSHQFQCSAHTLLVRLSSATPFLVFPPLTYSIWKKYIIFLEFPWDIAKSTDISSISPFYKCYKCLWLMSDVTVVIPLRAQLFPNLSLNSTTMTSLIACYIGKT